jgi:histidine triad (HIT) family protein
VFNCAFAGALMAEPDFDKMSPQEIAEYQKANCIFCKIVKGEIPSRIVYDDPKVLCILDIYPACKGHMLMMTKEHYPFLPVIPPDLAKHMFRITKGMSVAGKSAVVSDKSTIFIANGGIAGQQAPHFLYHIIPRENNDGLDNFIMPANDINPAESDRLAVSIKQRITGLVQASISQKSRQGSQAPMQQQVPAGSMEQNDLARLIVDNPNIKELIIKDPLAFRAEAEKSPELKKLFDGVDILKLAESLKQMN